MNSSHPEWYSEPLDDAVYGETASNKIVPNQGFNFSQGISSEETSVLRKVRDQPSTPDGSATENRTNARFVKALILVYINGYKSYRINYNIMNFICINSSILN